MRKILLAIVLLGLASAIGWFAWPPQSRAHVLTYTVVIHPSADQAGSGTIIGNAVYKTSGKPVTFSLVLTCEHVVGDTKDVKVHYQGRDFDATVVAIDKKLDLALLLVKEHWQPAPLHFGSVTEGEEEIAAGAPLDTAVVLTRGMVGPPDAKDLEKGHVTRQGTAAIWPGNSGGGIWVYRAGWKLAGVAEMIHTVEMGKHTGQFWGFPRMMPQLAPNVSYSITMKDVGKFLSDSGYR